LEKFPRIKNGERGTPLFGKWNLRKKMLNPNERVKKFKFWKRKEISYKGTKV